MTDFQSEASKLIREFSLQKVVHICRQVKPKPLCLVFLLIQWVDGTNQNYMTLVRSGVGVINSEQGGGDQNREDVFCEQPGKCIKLYFEYIEFFLWYNSEILVFKQNKTGNFSFFFF